jgi:phosphoglycerate dehydrogenase-like enzyme
MVHMLIKVTALAFSKNEALVDALRKVFPEAEVNTAGIRYKGDALVDYLSGADGAIVGLEPITAGVLDRLPALKIISKFGVGLDNVDQEACRERNVTVGWTPGVNKESVAELALGCMLGLVRNIYAASSKLKQEVWEKNGGAGLSGKTIGIIGLGHIGKELVRLLAPFRCRIFVNDIVDISDFAEKNGLVEVSKEELLAKSDIVTIHTPLTETTRHFFNADTFNRMKPGAFLINTARGGIINENDLKQALQQNRLAGAALDVFEQEPPTDRELLSLPNLICTPHIGGNSYEAVMAMGLSAIGHLEAFYNKQTGKNNSL